MSKIVLIAKNQIDEIIKGAFEKAINEGTFAQCEIPSYTIEVPADNTHGDYATNVAMVSARSLKSAPRKIAESLVNNFNLDNTYFSKVEIAGPGFINFFLNDQYNADVIKDVLTLKESYGRSDFGKGEKVMIEFVSANPTGPMHLGNARGGALGDCLAAVMDAAGFDVAREFYVNDAGNQIEKFGVSLEARYMQQFKGEENYPLPEGCYQGGDIKDRAVEYIEKYGDKLLNVSVEERKQALIEFALPLNIAKMRADIGKYRIEYDKWFMESDLHNDGEVKETLDILTNKGMTYEKEGALWYKATEYGAEKDEVLVRANGNPTYFAADIAYHRNKFVTRKFDRCIDIWGADHHGHVARMKGAMDSIGLDSSKFDVVLMQLVKLLVDGVPTTMSKRTGKAIQLADLLDEVPVDAVRFFFNMRESNSQMDFDIELARRTSSENPVYYVQYAHARICSILRNLAEENITFKECTTEQLKLLVAPEEKELVRHLCIYTEEIISAAKDYDPTRITKYVLTLASLFHKFYTACHIKGEGEDLLQARLALVMCVKTVISNVLTMFKINLPEKM